MTHRAGCSAGIVALGYIGISPGAGAAEWVFGIENHANDAIVEFRTQDNDGWSVNHVGHPVDVGAERVISFGECYLKIDCALAWSFARLSGLS